MLLLLSAGFAPAQDPSLPATNLGMANIQDGFSPGPGWYYLHYIQLYQPRRVADAYGNSLPGAVRVSSLLAMHQLIHETKIKVAGGNLAFSLLLPLVKLTATGDGKSVLPSVNPGVAGGLIFGPVIQWSNKRLLGLPYAHRAEIDLSVPLASYNIRYDINPSSRLYTITAYYAFTLWLTKGLSISNRHNINYNSDRIGTGERPGMFYNVNFSVEQQLFKGFCAAITGYYLTQLGQDAYHGDTHYYQETYQVADTRERVLGLGPGVSYVFPGGLAAELKVFLETAARNRQEGARPTLKLAYQLNRRS